MPSTKQATPDIAEGSFFLIGDSGAGKTRMTGTFPTPFIFDFDKGIASLSDKDIEYATFKDAPNKGKAMPERGIYPYGTGWVEFQKKINEIGADIDADKCEFQTISLDSATMMADLCMNYVLKEDGHAGKAPQIQHWGRQIELLRTLFDQFTAWPRIKIITAHIQRNTNDLQQTTEMLPLLTGKFAAKSSIYFDEVYFLEIDKEGRSVIRTQSTPIRKAARSRFNVPDGTLADFAEISKVFGGKKK